MQITTVCSAVWDDIISPGGKAVRVYPPMPLNRVPEFISGLLWDEIDEWTVRLRHWLKWNCWTTDNVILFSAPNGIWWCDVVVDGMAKH